MNICDGNRRFTREEICYESKDCPFCSSIDDYEDKIKDLKVDIENLNDNIITLEEKKNEYEDKLNDILKWVK